jgi:hypothetical protein
MELSPAIKNKNIQIRFFDRAAAAENSRQINTPQHAETMAALPNRIGDGRSNDKGARRLQSSALRRCTRLLHQECPKDAISRVRR